MLARSQQLIGAKIISLHASGVIAEIMAPLINPDKLEIVGFYVSHPKSIKDDQILLVADIRQIAPGRLFINSVDELTAARDLVRLKQVLEIAYELTDKKVITESGKKLGRVSDYIIDTTTWLVQKIYVKQGIIKSVSATDLIIDRSQITEVTDNTITVSDATLTKAAVVPKPAA